LKSGRAKSSNSVLFRIASDILGPLHFHMHFRIFYSYFVLLPSGNWFNWVFFLLNQWGNVWLQFFLIGEGEGNREREEEREMLIGFIIWCSCCSGSFLMSHHWRRWIFRLLGCSRMRVYSNLIVICFLNKNKNCLSFCHRAQLLPVKTSSLCRVFMLFLVIGTKLNLFWAWEFQLLIFWNEVCSYYVWFSLLIVISREESGK
jgi:hypothetical protein